MATDFEEWINRIYIKPQGKLTAMSELEQVFLSMVPKQENMGGESFTTPAYISTPRGHGRTRSEAQSIASTTAGGGSYGAWKSTPGNAVSSVEFSNREVAQSQGMSESGFAAFAEAQKTKIDGLIEGFGSKMSRLILGPPGSYLFQAASISSGVITLDADYADVIGLIEPGDQLQLSDEDGDEANDTLVGSESIGYVIAVDPEGSQPTVTVSTSPGGSASSPTAWEANGTGYLYKRGEFQGGIDRGETSPSSSKLVIDSIQAWNPPTTLTNTFKGVDRSVTSKLTGLRRSSSDITGLNIEECLLSMFRLGRQRYGWKGGQKIFMNSTEFGKVADSLETRRIRGMEPMKYERGEGTSGSTGASFGYSKIKLFATSGAFEIIDEPHMPPGLAIATDPSKWRVRSAEGFPQAMDKDGNRILRKTTDDDYEFRLTAYASFMLAPDGIISHTGRTALPS